ncbi:condensin-2 complex subunit D3-L-like [Periplaneta americana]|uniref:condensin-2 complex subunit D3-L-like n=1 Tax=Periplaneta americana TaxID=6978 RepID=UPI0037E78F75
MEVVNAVDKLNLESLDSDYVESVWAQEFMGDVLLQDYCEEYYQENGVKILNRIIIAVDKWQNYDFTVPSDSKCRLNEEEEGRSWKQLIDLNLNYKALLSLIWHFINDGEKNKCEKVSRTLATKASCLYIKLITVSGSRVYNAFHPFLCFKCMSVLKFASMLTPKRKKSRKNNLDSSDDWNNVQLSSHEALFLAEELYLLLGSLKLFLLKFSLESQEELLEEIIERLIETTRLEVTTPLLTLPVTSRSEIAAVTSLALRCYDALECLCSPLNGEVEDIVIMMLKHLLPSFLLSDHDLSFREQCMIKEHSLHFVKFMFSKLGPIMYRGLTILVHHVFTRIGEKAEVRQKGKETIVSIMGVLPYQQYRDLVKWMCDCAHSDRPSYRLLALEVISQLLHENPQFPSSVVNRDSVGDPRCSANGEPGHSTGSEPGQSTGSEPGQSTGSEPGQSTGSEPGQSTASEPGQSTERESECSFDNCSGETELSAREDVLLHKCMLAVIFARFRDSSGSVKAKALSLIGQCMASDKMVVRSLMNEIFLLNSQQEDRNEKGFLKYKQIVRALNEKTCMDPLPSAGIIIKELKRLACDSKVNVRKTALQALESIVKHNRSWLTGSILKMMGLGCRDPSVSIRKEMVQILSDLLQKYPDDKELARIWAKCVVPLVLDQEGKLQECVLKAMRQMILDNLKEYSQQENDVWSALPWQLLAHIVQFNHHMCFMKACEVWVKAKEIRSTLVKELCTHVGTENNLPAWIVLYCLSTHMDLKKPLFAVEYYREAVASKEVKISTSLLVIVLEVLLSCCSYLPRQIQQDMLDEFLDKLCNFTVQCELIRLNVEIAVELTYHLSNSKKDAARKVKSWTGEILKQCETYLQKEFEHNATKALDGDLFGRHVHMLGEVAIHNPRQVNERTFVLLHQFLFLSDRHGEFTSPFAKALAVVTMGKLCILNQVWAHLSAKPLVQLLQKTQDLPTIVNIIYVLRDLCVRYGAIMEPHLPRLWLCLKDISADVRLTALTCLVELLQGDYVKLRGAMFFHLLTALCDKDEAITELAKCFLRDCLAVTNKNIMYEHLIEALFHYNEYKGHEVYGKCSMAKEERENFVLKGEQFRKSRELIYAFMLENMDDEHRMLTRTDLVLKVLDGAAEGKIELNNDGESVVLDALHVLNSKEIRLIALDQGRDEDPAADNVEKATTLLIKARNKAIAECMKKNMIEYVVPVVIHLKAVLQEKYSKLVPDLMIFVRDMMKDYKNEVKQIFAEDSQMAIEILSDIRELERKQSHPQEVESERAEEEVVTPEWQMPPHLSNLLLSASPWIQQSLGPEMIRCYQAGGEQMMMQYARSKLMQYRQLTQQNRRSSHSDSFIQQPKEEGGDTEVGNDAITQDAVEEEEEEEEEDRETEDDEFGGKSDEELGLNCRETTEQHKRRQTTETEPEQRGTAEQELERSELSQREFDGGETGELDIETRQTAEEELEGETSDEEYEMSENNKFKGWAAASEAPGERKTVVEESEEREITGEDVREKETSDEEFEDREEFDEGGSTEEELERESSEEELEGKKKSKEKLGGKKSIVVECESRETSGDSAEVRIEASSNREDSPVAVKPKRRKLMGLANTSQVSGEIDVTFPTCKSTIERDFTSNS